MFDRHRMPKIIGVTWSVHAPGKIICATARHST